MWWLIYVYPILYQIKLYALTYTTLKLFLKRPLCYSQIRFRSHLSSHDPLIFQLNSDTFLRNPTRRFIHSWRSYTLIVLMTKKKNSILLHSRPWASPSGGYFIRIIELKPYKTQLSVDYPHYKTVVNTTMYVF